MTTESTETDVGRPATLTDVARAAGVSVGTASKALNGRTDVGLKTRQRVLDVANKMAFRPNALARSLLRGKTESVGIVTSDLDGRFAPQITVGAENALGADQSTVLLSNSRGDRALESHHIRMLQERRVDGLILVGREPVPRRPAEYLGQTPTVYAFAPSSDQGDCSIVPDNVGGARLAVEHLAALGRSSIIHLGGPVASIAAQDRATGSRQAMAALELPSGPLRVLFGDWLEQWGWDAVNDLLDNHISFDGLVCGNDQIARGAIDALIERGVHVPGEVAVVGFDNWEVLSVHGRHPITSVDLDLEGLGRSAAEFLIGPGPLPAGVHLNSCTLVVRSSSSP